MDGAAMLGFDDARWLTLTAGYRVPVDLRPLLRRLESGSHVESAWEELWGELHHQGDVGPGSYVAVPHLVRIHRSRGVPDWNTYALVATIELARGETVRAILSILAIAHGARTHGRILAEFTEDEVVELESMAFGDPGGRCR
jgi:hypothetical protein